MNLDELLAHKHPTSWVEFEHGRIDEGQYCSTFFKDGRNFDVEAFKRCMKAAYEWLPGVEELLIELKHKGVPMYALSNYPTWYLMIEEKLGLSRYVDWRFVSCLT